jgi:hypothetical protein
MTSTGCAGSRWPPPWPRSPVCRSAQRPGPHPGPAGARHPVYPASLVTPLHPVASLAQPLPGNTTCSHPEDGATLHLPLSPWVPGNHGGGVATPSPGARHWPRASARARSVVGDDPPWGKRRRERLSPPPSPDLETASGGGGRPSLPPPFLLPCRCAWPWSAAERSWVGRGWVVEPRLVAVGWV